MQEMNKQEIAKYWADWLLDAIAGATQDRKFLRGDPEYDPDTGGVILKNGEKAILNGINRFIEDD